LHIIQWTTDWITGGVSSVVNKVQPSSMLITASVDFVSFDGHVEENTTEFICTHWLI